MFCSATKRHLQQVTISSISRFDRVNVTVKGFVLYVTDCLNQNTHLLIKSVNVVQVMYVPRVPSPSSSLLCWIWQMFELPAKRDSFTKAVCSWHSSTHCCSFTVLSPPPHSPRNPSKCLYPRLPTGTPLRLHPRESWEIDVREDKGTVLQWHRVMVLNESWEFRHETRLHLACTDQFVVSEFCQLSPQRQVRVHQEGLSTALVEILEGQSCEE